MPLGWPLAFDWRRSPHGVRQHAGHGAVAFCGVPRLTNDVALVGDKCRVCIRLINRRAKAAGRAKEGKTP